MKIKTTLLFFFVCCASVTYAQHNNIIYGKVVDAATQQPLADVTVRLKNSNTYTETGSDGSFKMIASGSADTLTAAFTGYTTYRLAVNGNANEIIINLQSHTGLLQEVTVNTGYQQISKERSTGAYNVISNRLINRSVSTGILPRIENLSPGVLFNHGDAAKTDAITIRGRSTMYANAAPLIVVDNFAYDGDINNINPNDVESITILKDAAAASIWGARAGNGVIVITTKKGRTAKPQVEVNVNTSVTGTPDLFNINQVSGKDYAYIERYLYKKHFYTYTFKDPYHSAAPPVATLLHEVHEGSITQEQADEQIAALENYDVRNDLENYFYRPAVTQQYAFNVSGKSEKISYYLSAGYDKDLPPLVGSSSNRVSLRSANSYQAAKNLELNAGITFTQSTNHTGSNSGYDYYSPLQSKRYTPYTRLVDENGNALPFYGDYSKSFTDTAGDGKLLGWTDKPLEDIDQQSTTGKSTDYVIYAGWNFKLTNNFGIEGRYQYESQDANIKTVYKEASYFARNLINNFSEVNEPAGMVNYIIPKGAVQDEFNGVLVAHQGRIQANYNNGWNEDKHQLVALAGFEIRSAENIGSNNRIYGYDEQHNTVNDHIDFKNYYPQYSNPDYMQVPNNLYLSGNTDHFLSYYGNAAYTFRQTYTLSGSARIDEANLFGVKTNQKGTPLWSAGVSWQIDHENFYHSNWLPVIKLRATYGYNGNISRQATAYTTIAYNTGVLTPLPIAFVTNPANPDLRWEKTGILNIGIDFSTVNNMLSGTIECYNKHATDLIAAAPIDPTLGTGNVANPSFFGNIASMQGQGVDIQIISLNTNKTIRWRTYYIFSYAKTKVTGYTPPVTAPGSYYVPANGINPVAGNPLFSIYSYKWGGLDGENGNPIGYLDGKQTEDYSAIYNGVSVDSLVYNGPAGPTIFGALRNEFTYKNFSLSFNISYKLGYYFRTSSVNYGELFNSWNGHGDFALRWQKPGDEKTTHVPSLVYPAGYYRDYFYTYSDVLVADAGNIRLEDVNLSYEITKQQYKKLPAQALKLFIYASNLGVLWRANDFNIDPYYNNTVRNGKSFSIGVNLIF